MPTFLKKLYSKKLLVLVLLVAFVFISIPNISSAFTEGTASPKVNWLTCVGQPVSCAIYWTTFAINAIMNLIIAFGAMIVRNILSVGADVVNFSGVQTGFSYSLGVANLGFVLGIIVIALATILRSQTYGIKQILWKLVVAAIAVNFGLVIAGTILNFSDKLAQSFLKPMGGEGGFTDQLVDAFRASQIETPPLSENTIVGGVASGVGKVACAALKTLAFGYDVCKGSSDAAAKNNAVNQNPLLKDLDNFMRAVLAMVLAIIFKFIVAFTLLALAILLLIRFVYISVLLVLLPLAWLMWIFPKFSHLSGKWWQNFLRWAFFPPIAIFFLYLAILTNRSSLKRIPITPSPAGSPEAALGIMTNASGSIGAMADGILVIALAIGGLFAANSFSIHGANVAMGAMKGAGVGLANWAQKAPGRAGRAAARVATRKEPSKPLLPRYEQPRGIFQNLVNAAHYGEGLVRRGTHAAGTPLRAVTEKIVPGGGAVAQGGAGVETPEKKTGAGAPVPAPPPARTPEGPPPMPLPSVPAGGAPRRERSADPYWTAYNAEIAAGGTKAKAEAAAEAAYNTEIAARTKEGEVEAKAAPKSPQQGTATTEGRTTEPPYATTRKIYGSDKSEAMPVGVDSRRLFERLADYGKGKKFFGEGKEFDPLKNALAGKDTLVRSVWEGMKKGSGLRIFKDGQQKLEDAERDRRLAEKITDAFLKKGNTPAQAVEMARVGVEKSQEKRKREREAFGGIMERLNKTMEEVKGAAKAGKEAATAQEAAAKEAAKVATHQEHEIEIKEEEV